VSTRAVKPWDGNLKVRVKLQIKSSSGFVGVTLHGIWRRVLGIGDGLVPNMISQAPALNFEAPPGAGLVGRRGREFGVHLIVLHKPAHCRSTHPWSPGSLPSRRYFSQNLSNPSVGCKKHVARCSRNGRCVARHRNAPWRTSSLTLDVILLSSALTANAPHQRFARCRHLDIRITAELDFRAERIDTQMINAGRFVRPLPWRAD